PNTPIIVPPPPDCGMNHVPVDGLKIAGSVFPSASKSAGIGMSPFEPNGNEKKLPSSLLRMYQKPSDGLHKAMSVLPSPVKSPGVGMSVDAPNCPARTIPSELLEYHHSPTDERKIEISVFPSPSKSNGAWRVTTLSPKIVNVISREAANPFAADGSVTYQRP